MCDIIGSAYELSRRRFLQGAGAAAVVGVAGGALRAVPARADDLRSDGTSLDGDAADDFRTRLVLLGVAGGPAWWGGSEGIASAVVVDEDVYVVDCGEGVWQQYRRAGLPGADAPSQTLSRLCGVFLTHLHSDHVVDYCNLWLFGIAAGGLAGRADPVKVFGPGDRGSLPPLFGPAPAPPVVNPDKPTPGLADMSGYLVQAFAADLNDRMRDTRAPDPRTKIQVHDIALPAEVIANANSEPAPPMDSVDVYQDARVKVTATLVLHAPTFPSFAYRFDSNDGAIVFSGDTTVTPNLVRLARGADILVHEVVDPAWVESLFPPPLDPVEQAVVNHILSSHTTIEQVGKVAEDAQVRTLVLSHLVPGDNPRERWEQAGANFSGRLVVGRDLGQIGVGRRRSAA